MSPEGQHLARLGGAVAMASRFLDAPGEQLLSYHEVGLVKAWGFEAAEDSARARARYAHPFYRTNQRLTASGYNLGNLGGI